MQKKFSGAALFLIGVLALTGAGCGQPKTAQEAAAPTASGAGQGATESESAPTATKTSGNITDTQCLDVLAHQMWAVKLMEIKKDMAASLDMVKQANALQARYGISDDDFEAACNAKIDEIDFYDRLEARMQDLGFVIE